MSMADQKFSQNDEQDTIGRIFNGVTGRLLDIGAYVPSTFSNSRALLDLGWSGVLVEPAPGPFKDLLDYYGANPRVELVNCAVGLDQGLCEFYDSCGDAVSTSSAQHKARWEAGAGSKFRKYWLNMVTVPDLVQQYGTNYNFLSLDVESLNFEIFKKIAGIMAANTAFRPKVLCVEHDGAHQAMREIVGSMAYREVSFNGENIIFSL